MDIPSQSEDTPQKWRCVRNRKHASWMSFVNYIMVRSKPVGNMGQLDMEEFGCVLAFRIGTLVFWPHVFLTLHLVFFWPPDLVFLTTHLVFLTPPPCFLDPPRFFWASTLFFLNPLDLASGPPMKLIKFLENLNETLNDTLNNRKRLKKTLTKTQILKNPKWNPKWNPKEALKKPTWTFGNPDKKSW